MLSVIQHRGGLAEATWHSRIQLPSPWPTTLGFNILQPWGGISKAAVKSRGEKPLRNCKLVLPRDFQDVHVAFVSLWSRLATRILLILSCENPAPFNGRIGRQKRFFAQSNKTTKTTWDAIWGAQNGPAEDCTTPHPSQWGPMLCYLARVDCRAVPGTKRRDLRLVAILIQRVFHLLFFPSEMQMAEFFSGPISARSDGLLHLSESPAHRVFVLVSSVTWWTVTAAASRRTLRRSLTAAARRLLVNGILLFNPHGTELVSTKAPNSTPVSHSVEKQFSSIRESRRLVFVSTQTVQYPETAWQNNRHVVFKTVSERLCCYNCFLCVPSAGNAENVTVQLQLQKSTRSW